MAHNKKTKNKKAAIDLSIGTVVIIVLAMSMLVLGLVLIQRIFSGATESVDILDDKVKGEITNLFADETSSVIVKLGSDKTAKIEQGGEPFRIPIAAKKPDKSAITDRGEIEYQLELDNSQGNCAERSNTFEDYITGGVTVWKDFDEYDGSVAFALVEVKIPDGAPICSQKVYVNVRESGTEYAGSFFIVQIEEKGFF